MSLKPAPDGMGDGFFDGVLDVVKNAASGAAKGVAQGVEKKPPTTGKSDNTTLILVALLAFVLMSKR